MNIEQQFMSAYDLFVNEIFQFFFSKAISRTKARDLTQYTFKETWRQVVRGRVENEINEIHDLLRLNARRLARTYAMPLPA